MTNGYPLESILAVDCGSARTSAVLIDIVEGHYRLIAHGEALSTCRPPQANVMLGVARAIAGIERSTGRELLDQNAQLIVPERGNGSGVDAFVATASAGAPLRVFLVGLAGEVSLASARQAIQGCNAIVADCLSLEDGIDRPDGIEDALQRFERSQPDVVVLVGGIDGGVSTRMLGLASIIALAYQVTDFQARPPVIYAGKSDMLVDVERILGDQCEIKVVDNVRPSMEIENTAPLTEELEIIYTGRKLGRLPGMGAVAAWSRVPVLPTNQARRYTLDYLAKRYSLNVVGLDADATQTSVTWATKERTELSIRNGWGLKTGPQIVDEVKLDSLLRWLPEECDREEAMQVILNLNLYASVVPGSRREMQLTQALAREALLPLVAQARSRWQEIAKMGDPLWDLIVLSGTMFENPPHPAHAALMALDTLQPIGVSALVVDSQRMASMAGAIATLEPLAAAQVLEADGFMSLGSIVAPSGRGKLGDVALRVKITYADGRVLDVEVPYGSLEVIPLGPGQKASLEIRPGRKFDLGLPRRGRTTTVEVDGGLLGVLVDARGRPLPLHRDMTSAQEAVQQWLWDLGA